MTRPHAATQFLRLVAVVQILTFAVIFMPPAWIASWHSWVGLGVMTDTPVFRYVLRGASYVQGAIGVLLWVMAMDVVRYRPLVLTTAIIYLVGCPAYYLIDSVAGIPRTWCIFDSAFCFVIGGILLALCLVQPLNPAGRIKA
jgi:hypothetical protein